MNNRRSGSLFLVLLIVLLLIGLTVLFWGAATYVKPRVPFGGPPVILRNVTATEHRS